MVNASAASTFRELSWLIPIIPLVAFWAIVFLGKRTPGRGSFLGLAATGAAFVIGAGAFLESIRVPDEVVERSITWISFPGVELELGMRVDNLATVMFVVVTFVSLLVQIYSRGYMHDDARYTWYFATLNLFTGSMLVLVIANNLVLLLVGWELVGICSYLLIGHWFEERANTDAAIKAFLTTKTGDLGFIIGIFVLFVGAGTFNIGELQEAVPEMSPLVVTVGALLLFAGAVGKSAQFPLHVWLPDAMAGPTPVSALIHAATMVTAGVYLVARLFPVFDASAEATVVIGIIASATMLLAAVLALVQRDIKRVLAYSTVSQLGYMMGAHAVGASEVAIFHLWTHAFFKALLFLGAGSVIHAVHTNDMYEMGGLRRYMPTTFVTFVIGSAALAGVPPLAGFWSKDEILSAAFQGGNYIVWGAALVTAFLTALYMTRAVVLTFFGPYRREHAGAHAEHGHEEPHESPPSMAWPLIVLAVLSVVAGWVGTPVRNLFVGGWVHLEGAFHPEFSVGMATISILIALAGIGIGWSLYTRAGYGLSILDPFERLGAAYRAAEQRFYIDDLYMIALVRPVRDGLSRIVYRVIDQRVVDQIVNGAGVGTVHAGRAARRLDEVGVDGFVNGTAWVTDRFGSVLRFAQSGNVQRYAVGLFVGVVVIAVMLFR